ncbi:MAG: family 43 glycosylhydrolase [Bacteroidetes bacterium]|nr:MAG: family 43 glycosylhydrolase [Bacteroidota bacterium]
MRTIIVLLAALMAAETMTAQQRTYCNPLNIDYGYGAIPNFTAMGKHRTTADPAITLFKGKYYLFSTNQYGYWWSGDMLSWNFIPRLFLKPYHKVYDELCAPAAGVIGDTLLLLGSTHTTSFPIWMSKDPTRDAWTEAVDSLQVGAWDPAFFTDDDGRLYLYWGSSNDRPLYGQEIDRRTFVPIGTKQELIRLHDDVHGWERFGEHADNTFLRPFIEGAWMNKHDGRYYLQYAAPGTEFSGYGDGVYVSDRPLGPFTYQSHNPFAVKPGGFARGAGHGATFQDLHGNWWHIGTIAISVKNNFERRLGYWPAGFDEDGILYCTTAYGDYPHRMPDGPLAPGTTGFAGWMLLNYQRPVSASSTLGGYAPNFAADEDIKTYWSARSGDAGEWFQSDLGSLCTVRALQVNYADQNAGLMGKQNGIRHRYRIRHSKDGVRWSTLVDKSRNTKDVPHDYVELPNGVETRYLRIENIEVPTGTFALSGFRVFGHRPGAAPDTVTDFIALRGDSERRNAWLKWRQQDEADGYVIYWGTAPEKLYNSVMVYGANEYYLRMLDRDRPYYLRIEAFNGSGIGAKSSVLECP